MAGLQGLGQALSTGGGAGVGNGSATKLTGQKHHPISKKVHEALENHPKLRGNYRYRDPRFVAQAKDLGAHNGYQDWHIALDKEVIRWIEDHQTATPAQFEKFLRERYDMPDLANRFPNGF
jgi:hypothetical protein